MTRCNDYYRKYVDDGNFCGLGPSEISRIKAYLELIDKIEKTGIEREDAIKRFSAGAARPLIAVGDDETRIKGLNYVVACLKRGEKVTEGDLKKSIRSFYGDSGKCSVKQSLKLTNVKKDEEPVISDSSPQVSVKCDTKPASPQFKTGLDILNASSTGQAITENLPKITGSIAGEQSTGKPLTHGERADAALLAWMDLAPGWVCGTILR